MDEKALQHTYDLFHKDGYNGSFEDYKALIAEDDELVDHVFNLFTEDGFDGDVETFKTLVGSGKIKGSAAEEIVVEPEITNQEHQDLLDPTIPQDTVSPLEEGSTEPIVDDPIEVKDTLPYGDYLDKDGNLQNRDMPYEEQLSNYKQGYSEAMNATGIFEFMKDYSPEDRKSMADQLVKKPSYTTKKYNHSTDEFDVVPTPEAEAQFSKNLPKDFDNFNTAKEFATALNIGIGKTINEDPLIQFEIKKSSLEAQDELKEYSKTLSSTYDLSDPESLELAKEDYDNRWRELVVNPVLKTDIYKSTVKQLEIVGADIAEKQNTAFGRYKDTFLNAMDIAREYSPVPAIVDLGEALAKGGINWRAGYNKAQVGLAQKDFEKATGNLTRLKADIASGKIKENQPASFGGRYSQKDGYTVGQVKGTVKEKIKYIEDELETKKASIVSDLEEIGELKEYASLFKSADFEDGIQFTDLVRVFGESVPQMAIAAAGTFTGNPILAGLGFMSMTTTEYGEAYMGAIEQGLVNDEKEINKENILEALSTGKYAKHAEALGFAVASAGSEYIGASGVAKATMKAFGVSGSIKKVTASLYRGEAKAFVRQAALAAEKQLIAGRGEAITEFAQGNFGQMSIGAQLGGVKGVGDYIDTGENMTSAIVGFSMGALIPFGGSVAKFATTELRNASRDVATKFDLGKLGSNLKAVNGFFIEAEANLKAKLESKELTVNEYEAELSHLSAVRNTGLKIPKNFSQATKKKVFDLILKKNKIEQSMVGIEPELVLAEKEEISKINESLSKISATEKLTINVVKAKGNLDIEIIQAKDATEAKTIAESKKMNLGKDANSTGYISEDGKTVIVDMDRAAALGEVNTASHELLHGVLFNSLYSINEEGTVEGKNVVRGLSAALKTELNKIDASALKNTEFAARLQLYKDQPSSIKAEEVLTLFADALFYGDIQYNESVFTKLKDFVRQVLQNVGYKNIEFNNGKDVYNFLKDFNKGVSRGKLGKGITKVAKEGAAVGSDIRRFQGKEAVPQVKESKSQLSKEQNESIAVDIQSIQDLKKESAELATKYGKDVIKGAKEIRLENKIIESVEPIVGRVVTNRTKALYDPIADDAKKAVSRQSFQDSMKSDLEAMILNEFNGKQDIEKFIVNRGFLRANDLAQRLGIKSAEEGITQGLEAAEKIAAVETVAETAVKPKYETLIQSKVLPNETVGKIKDKITKTVTLLKSKMDAKVSLNRAVTPLVAEIKKEMGKQADIDLKKAMGGKKGGVIEKFLLKNKRAILENMTTTWLMGAMPGAIQKQVDGSFTSDWQDKKIDRESVSTDNSGKTSGAEITRRKPNVANTLSDADFLGYILDKTGNPIRGRKESLAKAMAEEISFDIFTQQIQDENSDISKAFEANQERLGVVLADNFVQDLSRQIDRGNVKFSLSATQYQDFGKHQDRLKDVLINQKVGEIKAANLKAVMIRIFIDENKTSFTNEAIADFVKKATPTVDKYFRKQKDINLASFKEFVINGVKKVEQSKNILSTLGIAVSEIFGSFRKLGDMEHIIERRRASEQAFNIQYVEKHGLEGMIRVAKWMKGHNSSSTKIGGGRGQYYANVADYYDNNLANIPGVKIKGGKVYFNDTLIPQATPSQKVYKMVNKKKVAISEKEFSEQYDSRQAEAKEAWALLTDFLTFVRAQNDPVLWVATMKSLDSNMQSILKAAANIEYYFVGETDVELRFEHLVPTNYMVLQLTNHFWNEKIDLASLQDAYSVAIIPKDMDENVNLQFQSTMTLDWNPMTDPAYERYYNNTTYGMEFIVPIRKIGGKDKGKIYGEAWAEFNSVVKTNAANVVAEDNIKDKAIENATRLKYSLAPKKIRVFDFDDTLARTKSNVLYSMPDGTKGKIDPATFAKEAGKMESEGAVWDFSEFSKIIDGKKGPLLEVAKIIADKRGTKDVFVLTARPQDAAGPIQEFLASMGLNIPIENITGLSDGNPSAKANWMVGKVAEGYNDFYFADDHTGNIKAVKDILNTFDVKGKVQLAKVKFSLAMDQNFNDMIARNKGIASEKEFSKVVAKRRGAKKGNWKYWMPGSLDDFKGLTSYVFAGKGKQGEADQKFFQDALITPYFRGVAAIETTRQTLKNDFKTLNKNFKPILKKLGKMTPDGDYTYDQAIRVALWNKGEVDVPGLSKRDNDKLVALVANDPALSAYADGLLLISKQGSWTKPGAFWDAQTILSDLNNMTEKSGRKEYIAEFIENVDVIFSEKNLNKIEAVYGTKQRDALEDIIYRMKHGTNRPSGMNKNANQWNNWVNNSIGAIMFFNRRSAALQLLSTVNFVNWSDNNPAKAALAFANQPQYWKDFATIFNSDKLRQRRSGLKSDVNEAEIANAVTNSTDKATAALSFLLKLGFTPTQIADSFAISAGGATFYRNRINSLKKKGLSQIEAEAKAWNDFSQISEETQQSGDPALISSDQASSVGRLVLSFMNTPIQLNRSIKKASLDIYNRRRIPGQTQAQSDISNVSKIIYYGAIQNIIFSTLQNALFALVPGFDDDEMDDEVRNASAEDKMYRVLHGMIDTTLKGGFGYPGAIVSTVKNVVREYNKQEEKGFTADHAYTLLQVANLSPPIGSKLRKIYGAIQTKKFDADVIKDRDFDVMLDGKFNISPSYAVLGSVVEGSLNIPVSRVVDELNSLTEALDSRNTVWQRIALGMGWKTWDVSAENEEHDLIKAGAKIKRKAAGKIKAKKTREDKKKAEKERKAKLSQKERDAEYEAKRAKRNEKARLKREAQNN